MRADRLVALMMLLQTRGKMTAPALAEELEVSERTIYRDIDALSAAGVPVYGEPGRKGGFALLDGYRTTLTGLTANEIRALFMLAIPAPLVELGVAQDLRAAQLKVAAALPGSRTSDERFVRERFHLDAVDWEHGGGGPPHLQSVHQAVWQDRKLKIRFRVGPLAVAVEQEVEPFGLVVKAGSWYLVYRLLGALRAIRLADLVNASILEQVFQRPEHFDLAEFWRTWCSEQERSRNLFTVLVRAKPDLLPALPRLIGVHVTRPVQPSSITEDSGYVVLELAFDSLETARNRLLACGNGIEVLAPEALRYSIEDFAHQILAVYRVSG